MRNGGARNMQNPVAMPSGGMTIFLMVTAVRPSCTRQAMTTAAPTTELTTDISFRDNMGNFSLGVRRWAGKEVELALSIMPVLRGVWLARDVRRGQSFCVGGLDFGGEGAVREAGADGVARLDAGSVAEEFAGGGVDEGVSAAEDGERRQGLKARGGVVEARGAGGDGGDGETAEGLLGALEAAAGEGEADGWVLAVQPEGQGGEAVGGSAEGAVGGGLEAVAEVVHALAAAADERLQAALDCSDGDGAEALAGEHELVVDGSADPCVEGLDALPDAVLGGGDEFGGG